MKFKTVKEYLNLLILPFELIVVLVKVHFNKKEKA